MLWRELGVSYTSLKIGSKTSGPLCIIPDEGFLSCPPFILHAAASIAHPPGVRVPGLKDVLQLMHVCDEQSHQRKTFRVSLWVVTYSPLFNIVTYCIFMLSCSLWWLWIVIRMTGRAKKGVFCLMGCRTISSVGVCYFSLCSVLQKYRSFFVNREYIFIKRCWVCSALLRNATARVCNA